MTKTEEVKKEEPVETPSEKTAKKKAAPKKVKKEEVAAPAPKTEEPKADALKEVAKPAPKHKKKMVMKVKGGKKAVIARGKRKESVARARIRPGKGIVRFNHASINSIQNSYVRDIIREPLRYMGPEVNSVDISVNVVGGGAMGQAQAARSAIANALIMYFDDQNLREKFISIDRSMVVDDVRRVEPKKYKGPKARARFQKSYR